MSKKEVKIIANDQQVADQVLNYLAQSEPQMIEFVDQRLRSSGYGETDTTVVIDGEKSIVRVSSKPEDKGVVQVLEGKKMVEVPYSDVENEAFYAFLKDGQLMVFHKFSEEGRVDRKLGSVKNFAALKEELALLPERYKQALEAQAAAEAETADVEDEGIEEAKVVEMNNE